MYGNGMLCHPKSVVLRDPISSQPEFIAVLAPSPALADPSASFRVERQWLVSDKTP